MSVGSTEPWARLRLVDGESTAQGWELVASLGQTTLTVGSGAQSTWQVRAEGVLPVHVSLLWDGAALRVADAGGSGDVRVDGVAVGATWVPVSGHLRLEFGKAALMVDTSAPRAGQSDHPLEPGSVPPATFSEPVSGAMPRLHKATLLGVAASDLPFAAAAAVAKAALVDTGSGQVAASDAAASAGTRGGRAPSEPPNPAVSDFPSAAPGDTGGFRVARPSDSERVRKATLLGAAISVPPPAPPGEAPLAATPSRGLSTGTLMGVVGPMGPLLDPRASSGAGGSPRAAGGDKLGDVRTIIGMPMSDSTIRGALGIAATQTELRPISATPPGERIASTWQEDAGSARPTLPPELPSESDPLSSGARYVDPVRMASPAYGSPRPGVDPRFDPRQTGPDANAQPKRSFPLQYVGIVVLTCAAYFAWLYLLDHW